jgi:SulP family sulfate permease
VAAGAEPEAAVAAPADSPFRPERSEPLLRRAIPVAAALPSYRGPTARRDVVAGITVAALAIPSAMAYAELAGIPPVHGLYALLLPMVAYFVLGSSRQLIVGPEGSVSVLVAGAVLPLAVVGSAHAAGLAATVALMVGVCFVVARLVGLGWVGDYFSRPVLVGYMHGIAIVLVISQLGKLLGISVSAAGPVDELAEILRGLGGASGATVLVSAVSLAALFLFRAFLPRFPATLLVVIAAIPLSKALDFAAHGVAVVGAVPSGLPSLELPAASATEVVKLLPAALGIFLVTFADEILTARSFAGRHGQHVRVKQELLAMGAADLAAGFSQGMPVGGSNARTAVNDAMGARTQVSGAVAAGVVVLILLFLTGPIEYLPKAVLGAVIVSAAVGLLRVEAWRSLAAVDSVEVAIAAVTTAGVVALGALEALVIAIGLSIVDAVRRSARPSDAVLGWVESLGRYADVSLHRDARTTPGIVVYRLDDRIFFANARYFRGRVHEAIRGAADAVYWLVLDAEAVTHADSTGLEMVGSLAEELERGGVGLAVARLRTRMLDRFEAVGLVDRIGTQRFYPSVRAAVGGCLEEMDAEREDTRMPAGGVPR